ncbi:MAG: bacterial Ig-like domain-containing protein [Bacteroidaceae bacterium]|nr:bacterial Ig-like domain-containing protein [Bacteroidaceae bacterium]
MKQHLLKNSFLRGVLFLLLCAVGLGNAWGEEVTVTFDATKQGYSNQQVINSATITNGITISFTKGTSSPAYYTSGTAIRCYAKGGFTITSTIGDITKIVFTYGSSDGSNAITVDVGSFNKNTWTGQASAIIFSIGGANGNRRIKTITVTYQTSTTPDAPTPELESIDFEAADDIVYYVGETVTEEGLTVTANYTNGTNADVTKDVENWSFTPGTINSINDNSISVEFGYAGKAYNTYSFNITVKSIANTAESAYSVAQACTLIDAGKGLSEEVYVKGIVSQVDNFNDEYGSITYWISDDGTTAGQQFQCYGGLDIGGEKFTSINDLKLGTVVVVKGLLKKYNATYEFDKNNVLISKDESNAKTLSSIEISGTPAKTSYYIGDTPSADGLKVNAVYSDESTTDVTNDTEWTVSPETITEGTTQVTATASYNGLTASHTYSIVATRDPKITDYTKLEDGKKYYIGATLSNGTDYYFSTTYTNIVEAVKGVAQTDKTKANILTAIAHSSESNKWAFQFENGYYLSLKDSKDNGMVKITAQPTFWVLSNTAKGVINMTINSYCLQRNNSSGTTNFGSYTSGQTDIWFLEVPTYEVEISSAGLATFCLPYNATIPDGLTAYTATDNGESVKLTAKEGRKIAAGEGVVLKGNKGTYTFVAAEGNVSPTAGNQMVGVTEDTELTDEDNAYMLTRKKDDGSIAFRLLKTNYTLEANRAYLKVDGSANTRELIPALWDDNATGIDNIAKDEVTATGAIYNLAGQKLMRAQKGINIINGKLVIK